MSLPNIWSSWYRFRTGKKRTYQLDIFTYFLEKNLYLLCQELTTGTYKHGSYSTFSLTDTKKRTISVACTRDKVIHRLLYDYLNDIFDKTFIYDAWSCREGKGLFKATKRAQSFLLKYRYAYVWRGDITKFFDSVDQKVLKELISRKINDELTLNFITSIIDSYSSTAPGKGMPIGNLISQIFTNIYLHEFDWYVMHTIKPLAYMRYGDDFLLVGDTLETVSLMRNTLIAFLSEKLKVKIHTKNNIIIPAREGVHFLGCDIFPTGRRLKKRVYNRILERLNIANSSSYRALVLQHGTKHMTKWVDWNIVNILDNIL